MIPDDIAELARQLYKLSKRDEAWPDLSVNQQQSFVNLAFKLKSLFDSLPASYHTTHDLSDLAGLWASEDPHFDVVVPLLLSVDGGASETPEAEADDTCRRCKGTKREPSPTGVPMIGAPNCMRCGGSGKQPKFSDLAATVRRHQANLDRPKVKDSCKNLVDHMQHKCVCYRVDL